MPKENVRISIPDLPQMAMQPHPNSAMQAHARYFGAGDGGYSISILTPTADPGMGAEECAASISRGLISRYAIDPRLFLRWKNDANTYVAVFPARVGPLIQFKAYFMSAFGGTHCLEVHSSKTVTATDKDAIVAEMSEWIRKFRSARIDPR